MGMNEDLAHRSAVRFGVSDAGINGAAAPSWVAKPSTPTVTAALGDIDLVSKREEENMKVDRKLATDIANLEETRDAAGHRLVFALEKRCLEGKCSNAELAGISVNREFTDSTRKVAIKALERLAVEGLKLAYKELIRVMGPKRPTAQAQEGRSAKLTR
ncbi:hypothetical protein HYT84_01475 [Candidatus Micrarchaeota archaeon]|nr:hypothetical protein [Candidatus Micrarchaeota archaeon]